MMRIHRKCLLLGGGLVLSSVLVLFLLLDNSSLDIDSHFKFPIKIDNSHYSLRALKNGPKSRANLITKEGLADYYDGIENDHDKDLHYQNNINDLITKQSSFKSNHVNKFSPVPCVAFEDVTLTCLSDNSVQESVADTGPNDKSSYENKDSPNQDHATHSTSSTSLFVPLKFLHDYYEIQTREIKLANGQKAVQLVNSVGKIYSPAQPYSHRGPYLWFDKFNVQVRDRVKYLCAAWSVPISTQWEPRGHYYPIQIAQFGLSHFSKSFMANASGTLQANRTIDLIVPDTVHFAEKAMLPSRWNYRKLSDSTLEVVDDQVIVDGLIDGLIDGYETNMGQMLVGKLKPEANFSLTCVVLCPDGNQFSLVYIASNEAGMHTDLKHKRIIYGLDSINGDKLLTRDLVNDLNKGMTPQGRRKVRTFQPVKSVKLMRLTIRGHAIIKYLRLQESADVEYFRAAAHWLMTHQDKVLNSEDNQMGGGWPIRVGRRLGDNTGLFLRPPWYSAMAQGHGMSLLSRIYSITGNVSYLEAALRASFLFDLDASQGGVRTHFMDRHVWYEEYPTTPTSTYVLNGFIYSLFGLYDTHQSCQHFKTHSSNNFDLSVALDNQCSRVGTMWEEGLDSLKSMLVLYDTGSGTLYDLRHVPLGLPPNVARWDYHTTHINQLLTLSRLLAGKDDKASKLFRQTAIRWAGYMRKGERAHHN